MSTLRPGDHVPSVTDAAPESGTFDDAPPFRGLTVSATDTPAEIEAPAPALGRFGDYDLLEELDSGGMGVVFRARDRRLNRPVALKTILGAHLARERDVRRFQAEAEAAAGLDHPHLVPIHDVGEFRGWHFYTMSLVEGGSLRDVVDESRPLTSRRAAELLRPIADAIRFAHARNIVHRDLKPSNVLLDDEGQPRVTDFGLAKNVREDSGLTRTGAVVGTPSYMAPEQAIGATHEIGPLADVYGLGAILYALLTGRPPFAAESVPETLRLVVEQDPVPPRRIRPDVDFDLETICLKCLEKDPARRYESVAHLVEELDRYLEGRPILARPVGRVEQAVRWCGRNPRSALLVASLVLSVVLGIVGTTTFAVLMARRAAEANEKGAAERAARQELAVSQYDLLLERIERETTPPLEPGWTWRALADVERAIALGVPNRNPGQLRTLTARCLGAFDARPIARTAGKHVGAVTFSADGHHVYVASSKGQPKCRVRVFEVETGNLVDDHVLGTLNARYFFRFLRNQTEFQTGFRAVAVDPHGEWVAAGTRFGRVVLWRTGVETVAQVLDVHPDEEILDLRFTPDGRTLLATPKVHERDARTLAVCRLDADAGQWKVDDRIAGIGRRIDVHPDGRRIVHSFRRQLGILDLETGTSTEWPTDLRGGCPSFSPTGDTIVVEAGPHLRRIALDEPRVLVEHTTSVGTLDSGRLRFVGDSSFVVSGNGDDDGVHVHDLVTGDHVATLDARSRSDAPFAVSPNGRHLAIAEKEGVRVYELRTPVTPRRTATIHNHGLDLLRSTVIAKSPCPAPPEAFTLAPDRRTAWGIVDRKRLVGWNLPDVEPVHEYTDPIEQIYSGNREFRSLDVGREIVAVGGGSGHVTLLDATSAERLHKVGGSAGEVLAVDLSPDETWVVAGTIRGRLSAWRTDKGHPRGFVNPRGGPILAVAVVDDSGLVAAADRAGYVTLWHVDRRWSRVLRFGPYAGPVRTLDHSPETGLTWTVEGEATAYVLDLDQLDDALRGRGVDPLPR